MKRIISNYSMMFVLTMLLSIVGGTSQATKVAEWITAPGFKHGTNQWFQFRKQINLDKKPETLKTIIAADSKYWLYINGELVVFEGQLKRGPNHNDTYCDELDLAPFLRKGENTIAALVWYFGREGFSHKDSKQMGFLMENSAFTTDDTWKINRYKAFQSTGNPQGNYRLPESNVKFDARLAQPEWITANFDDSKWETAKSAGEKGSAPWNKLFVRPIPMFKTFDLTKVDDYKQTFNKFVVKLPYNMQYHPYLKVKAPAGKLITIDPDNLKTLNDTPLRGEYITKEGEQQYLHLPWLSGHEMHIKVEEGVEVLELGYMESGYDTEFDGTFEVADEYLMRYFKKAQRTLYVNMRDTYFDCPDRERAQWIGDGTILMEESFYLLNNKAIDLAKKMYTELFDWQRGDNTMYGPIPAGNWHNELPQQILAAVGNYGIGRYYMYTGDEEMVKKAYPHLKKYLGLWKVAEDGTVPFRRGGWTWGDWGSKIDRELAEHIWVYIALDNLSSMAERLGKADEAKEIRSTMDAIKKRVNTVFWTKEGYRSTTFKEETDDRGNALAVVSGIADKSKYPTIINLFKKVEHASPYMEKYVMEALFKMNEGKFAIDRFKKRYANMVNHPTATTLWEFWTYGASINHAWSGGPLSILFKNMAGVVPTKPGFEEFTVFPNLLDQDSLKVAFSTVKGDIALKVKDDKKDFKAQLTVPKQTSAIVRIPVSCKKWKIRGGNYQENGEDSEYRYFKLPAGDWTVTYEYINT
ncbi:glycoside hydrolase [Prolixibacteraceae bacterium JC049]|nr:glycoside hydrolase [Prolixibacteraceae bacterium JC049]